MGLQKKEERCNITGFQMKEACGSSGNPWDPDFNSQYFQNGKNGSRVKKGIRPFNSKKPRECILL
jgi:hypothetical protein